jgi:Tol biopolymer transport system component
MAPEQLSGGPCDARTDIFALGLVLLEMATGKPPQVGFREPPVLDGVPERLAHVMERCLARDPDDRWQSASDVRRELEWAAGTSAPPHHPPRATRARTAVLSVAALGGLALIVAGMLAWRRAPAAAPEHAVQFTLTLEGEPSFFALSPDGRYLSFALDDSASGASSLWVRPLDSATAKALDGTHGNGYHLWSPDSRWIAFYADGKLKKISPLGGPAQTIADVPGFVDAAWSPEGDIVYRATNRAALLRLSAAGGPSTPVTRLNESLTENSHRFPQFLPDGRRFMFVSRCGQRENNALYIGSLDSPALTRVMPAHSQVRYVPQAPGRLGRLLFYRDGAVMSQAFDPEATRLSGEPVPLVDDVDYNPTGLGASFRVSADGRVMVVTTEGANDSQLLWVDRKGATVGTLGPPGAYSQARISPDATRVAFTTPDPQTGNRDIASIEIARGVTARLTTHVANDWYPVWSPDGQQLLFGSDRDGGAAVPPFIKASLDIAGEEAPVPKAVPAPPLDWSRDGQWMLLSNNDIWVMRAGGPGGPFAFLATRFREAGGRFSPDGKWIAYVADETGRYEVYVRPFTGTTASATGKIQISQNGGDFPVWGPGNRELFYMTPDSVIHAVDVRTLGQAGATPAASRLFEACPETNPANRALAGASYNTPFDTHDGQRFLVTCRVQPAGRYLVLLNWLDTQS